MKEPMAIANILTPKEYVGAVIGLCTSDVAQITQYAGNQLNLSYRIPMNEIVSTFLTG